MMLSSSGQLSNKSHLFANGIGVADPQGPFDYNPFTYAVLGGNSIYHVRQGKTCSASDTFYSIQLIKMGMYARLFFLCSNPSLRWP